MFCANNHGEQTIILEPDHWTPVSDTDKVIVHGTCVHDAVQV